MPEGLNLNKSEKKDSSEEYLEVLFKKYNWRVTSFGSEEQGSHFLERFQSVYNIGKDINLSKKARNVLEKEIENFEEKVTKIYKDSLTPEENKMLDEMSIDVAGPSIRVDSGIHIRFEKPILKKIELEKTLQDVIFDFLHQAENDRNLVSSNEVQHSIPVKEFSKMLDIQKKMYGDVSLVELNEDQKIKLVKEIDKKMNISSRLA